MTDADGDMVQHYNYSAFGNAIGTESEDPFAFRVSNRYTGQILDEDTGLYFYGARYYDPELARFIQADSVVPEAGSSQVLNRYSYCVNNPLKYVDPTGNYMMNFTNPYSSWGGGGWNTPAISGGYFNTYSYFFSSFSSGFSFRSRAGSSISSYYTNSMYSSLGLPSMQSLLSGIYGGSFNIEMADIFHMSDIYSKTSPAYYGISPSVFKQYIPPIPRIKVPFDTQDLMRSCVACSVTNLLGIYNINQSETDTMRRMRLFFDNTLNSKRFLRYGVYPSEYSQVANFLNMSGLQSEYYPKGQPTGQLTVIAQKKPVMIVINNGWIIPSYHSVVAADYSRLTGKFAIMDPLPEYNGRLRFMSSKELRKVYQPDWGTIIPVNSP